MQIAAIAPGHRLQFEESQNQFVLLYPEGMVQLSGPAADVLFHCISPMAITEIIAKVAEDYETADSLEADIRAFLEDAHGRGWITLT